MIIKVDKSNMEMDSMKPTETWRVVKNVVVLSLAFMVHFTAYHGTANLQSSINAEAGLGPASLVAVYAGLIFSNLFLPAVIIKWLGTKWTICLSFMTYMPYMAAQLKPTFYTMIPAGLIVGLGGGPLWCAQSAYLSLASEFHSKLSKIPFDVLLNRFMGLFFMIFNLDQVWGNLTSSLGDNKAAVTSVNISLIPELCGANFLPSANAKEALKQQPLEKIQIIAGIYLICMMVAVLIVAVGVDSVKRSESECKSQDASSRLAMLFVTLKLLVDPNQLLLAIISIFIGYQQAFFHTDFTAAFVSCTAGTGFVGFVMITYGLANTVGCFITGYLVKITGRLPIMGLATVIHTALFITFLAWKPQPGFGYVLHIIAVLWGLCNAIWGLEINVFYGVLYPGREEAAYSNYHLWKSIGHIAAYAISPHLRTSSKTYLMIAMMTVGLVGYFVAEYKNTNERKSKSSSISCKDQ